MKRLHQLTLFIYFAIELWSTALLMYLIIIIMYVVVLGYNLLTPLMLAIFWKKLNRKKFCDLKTFFSFLARY